MITCERCGGALALTTKNGVSHKADGLLAIERISASDGDLIIRHCECVNGHRFHATGPETQVITLPEYGQVPCDCPDGDPIARLNATGRSTSN
jgi:hypothetical protein